MITRSDAPRVTYSPREATVVGLAWLAAALALGLILGRILRRRDQQRPRGDQ